MTADREREEEPATALTATAAVAVSEGMLAVVMSFIPSTSLPCLAAGIETALAAEVEEAVAATPFPRLYSAANSAVSRVKSSMNDTSSA